ncbi:MAG: hypothetical protein AB7L13_18100 [Acidimicrobiia bacterium]
MKYRRALLALVVAATSFVSSLGSSSHLAGAAVQPDDWGEFTPLTPERILDTRTGTGAAAANSPVGVGAQISVQILGRGGVPASGVTAVVMNVTATQSSEDSFLTVFPTGATRPTASTVNFRRGQSVPNLTVAKVGDGGQISVYNDSGNTHVLFDVVGWYSTSSSVGTKSRLRTITPERVLDTRQTGSVGANASIPLPITGRAGVPSGATGVVLNITGTNATAGTFITAYPSDVSLPTASNLNLQPNQSVPNLAMVRLPANGQISLYNFAGTTDLVVDVVGYYDRIYSDTSGQVMAMTPSRKVDTRLTNQPLGPDGVAVMQFSGIGGVILNVTVTGGTEGSFLTVFPATNGEATTLPTASNLNFVAGQTVANLVTVKVPPSGVVAFYNYRGNVHVVVDVVAIVS